MCRLVWYFANTLPTWSNPSCSFLMQLYCPETGLVLIFYKKKLNISFDWNFNFFLLKITFLPGFEPIVSNIYVVQIDYRISTQKPSYVVRTKNKVKLWNIFFSKIWKKSCFIIKKLTNKLLFDNLFTYKTVQLLCSVYCWTKPILLKS